jgi:hypothetical protein
MFGDGLVFTDRTDAADASIAPIIFACGNEATFIWNVSRGSRPVPRWDERRSLTCGARLSALGVL